MAAVATFPSPALTSGAAALSRAVAEGGAAESVKTRLTACPENAALDHTTTEATAPTAAPTNAAGSATGAGVSVSLAGSRATAAL